MQIDVITIFPTLFGKFLEIGILGKAISNKIVKINIHDLRDYTNDKHKQVDDRPFGGGPGMILKPEPLFKAINTVKERNKSKNLKSYVIFLTPQGKKYNQEKAETLSKKQNLILICGRYEGIDQRVRDNLIDEEVSIGNYVLSGGEIPAMVIADSVTRLIPGVIGNVKFNDSESFSDAHDRFNLDYPQYTRPAAYESMKVPDILLNGNHNDIKKWREKNRTKKRDVQ